MSILFLIYLNTLCLTFRHIKIVLNSLCLKVCILTHENGLSLICDSSHTFDLSTMPLTRPYFVSEALKVSIGIFVCPHENKGFIEEI